MRVAMLGGYPYYRFAEQLGCSPIPRGGNATWMVNLCEHLSKTKDVDLHVVTELDQCERGLPKKVFTDDLITYHFLPAPRRFRATTFFVQDCIRIRKELKIITPDIVHAHHTDEYALAALTSGFCTLITVHGTWSNYIKVLNINRLSRSSIIFLIERFCLKSGKYFISINPYSKDFILRSNFGKIFEVENPVHDIYFKCKDRTKNGRILFVALLTPIKGVIELLHVTRLVRDSYSNVKLHIVGLFGGDLGWYEREVHKYINKYNLKENVEFMGFKDEEGVMKELSLSNCLVMTSKSETAPTVISEAMAAGKPVVAMDVGGIRYMVQNGFTGYLISPDDFRGMADKIIRILRDESLRKIMGNAARLVALERFHPDIVAKRTLETYKDILTTTN